MIIGVRGFIGAGKDTFSNFLVKKYKFEKMSFADNLKDAAAVIFGWPRHLLQGDTPESRAFREEVDTYWEKHLKFQGFTPRKALQLIGTEAGRNVFGDNLWIAGTMKKAQAFENVVISDCRFVNEANAIRANGGKIVWIVRGDLPEWYSSAILENVDLQKGTMKSYWPDVHPSEWDIVGDKADVIVPNDYSLIALETMAHSVINNISKLKDDNFAIFDVKEDGDSIVFKTFPYKDTRYDDMA